MNEGGFQKIQLTRGVLTSGSVRYMHTCTALRYLYCFAEQTGFYGDVIEYGLRMRRVADLTLSRGKNVIRIFHPFRLAPNLNTPSNGLGGLLLSGCSY